MPPSAPVSDTKPMSVTELLAFLTSNGLAGSLAMKVIPALMRSSLNTKSKLGKITEKTCVQLGVDDKESRKALLMLAKRARSTKGKKFTRDSDLDRPLAQPSTSTSIPTYDFKEQTDEWFLQTQRCVINRAPVMCAWAVVVAERLSFSRTESLSIAQAFTELNANSRAVAQGIPGHSPATKKFASTQPYVDLMGRRVYLLGLQDGSYRALGNDGQPIEPDRAWGYLSRSFAQQLGAVVGAMRLLADSFEPGELNDKGYGLYSEFRPQGSGWGEKSELKYLSILDLRRYLTHVDDKEGAKEGVKQEATEEKTEQSAPDEKQSSPFSSKVKLEEEDVKPALGEDFTSKEGDEFDALLEDDLDFSEIP